jgi:hypothetical protein
VIVFFSTDEEARYKAGICVNTSNTSKQVRGACGDAKRMRHSFRLGAIDKIELSSTEK